MAHDLAPIGLRLWADIWGAETTPTHRPFSWKGLQFQNRLGIAGGVDKNATLLQTWQKLGFGFCEIGTVTPMPQEPNPGTIVDRDWSREILWNKMGFPSEGMRDVCARLTCTRSLFQGPVFVNIGKNRNTSAENASADYVQCAEKFLETADAFVVNVSSPNTAGLRGLQSASTIRPLLESVIAAAKSKPVLVKLSPDMDPQDLLETLDAAGAAGVSGFVLTNTTLDRPQPNPFSKEGGVSGRFVAEKSKKTLQNAVKHLGTVRNQFLITSVGGIFSPEDMTERLELGADLVQVYSALIFQGPGLARSWLTGGALEH